MNRSLDFIVELFFMAISGAPWRDVMAEAPDHITDQDIEFLWKAWRRHDKQTKRIAA